MKKLLFLLYILSFNVIKSGHEELANSLPEVNIYNEKDQLDLEKENRLADILIFMVVFHISRIDNTEALKSYIRELYADGSLTIIDLGNIIDKLRK